MSRTGATTCELREAVYAINRSIFLLDDLNLTHAIVTPFINSRSLLTFSKLNRIKLLCGI